MKKIYLDNNATTGLDPEVIHVMQKALNDEPLNPSSSHWFGQKGKKLLFESRDSIANFFNISSQEIYFTSGGTESLNFLIKGFYSLYPKAHIISSNVEHLSVSTTLESLKKAGASIEYIPVGLWGCVQPFQLEKAITPQTKLIVLSAVNSVTGVKTDIVSLAKIAEQCRIPFIVDGVQLLGKEVFTIPSGVSGMAFSGHKFHGPQGIGFAILKSEFNLPPLILGGHQENGKRGGTANLLGIVGLAKAVELLKVALPKVTEEMQKLRDHLTNGLMYKIGNIVVHGLAPRICNTVHIGFPGADGETLLFQLDQAGIAVSHGSACSSGGLEPSSVLINMELPLSLVKSSLRFSLSRFTTLEEINKAIEIIFHCVERQKQVIHEV